MKLGGLLIFGAMIVSVSLLGAQQSDIKVYDKFDDFDELLRIENDTTYVINFWATWCKPCVAELPYFEKLYTSQKNQKVKVVLVSLDFKRKLSSKLIPFIEKNKIGSEVVLLADPKEQEWIDRVDPSWSGVIPITIIYKNKKRVFLEREFHSYEDLLKQFSLIHN